MNKNEFCERLLKLRYNSIDVILDRFFELVDTQKNGWINKTKFKRFLRNNITQKEHVKIVYKYYPQLWNYCNINGKTHAHLTK